MYVIIEIVKINVLKESVEVQVQKHKNVNYRRSIEQNQKNINYKHIYSKFKKQKNKG